MNKVLNMLKVTFEVLLVILFIFFEEIVWEYIAVPIKNKLSSMKILQGVQTSIESKTAYQTLGIFLVLFILVEVAGIYAGILLVQGLVVTAVILYASKLPLAGLTFWIFSFSKVKLLSIDWFETLYNLVMRLFDWIKSTRIYRKVRYSIRNVKRYVKNLKGGNGIKDDIDHVYKGLKMIFKGRNNVR